MASLADIFAEVKLDLTKQEENKLRRKIGQIDTKREGAQVATRFGVGFNGAFGGIVSRSAGAFAAGFAGLKVGGFLKGAILEASDLGETMSKAAAVFGPANKEILKFGETAAESLGQSTAEAIGAASSFGNLFVQLGIGQKPAAQMSKQMVTLASDFASFHNADITEVLQAQEAAFRGEYDSVQKFVPTINAAAVEQEALRLGLGKSTKELDAQDKALATQSLLMKGAGKASGDFAKTSGGLANQQRILSARFSDFKTSIGKIALPMVTGMFSYLNDTAIPVLEQVPRVVDKFTGLGKRIVTAIGPIDLKGIAGQIFTDAKAWVGDIVRGLKIGIEGGDWKPLGTAIGTALAGALRGAGDTVGAILDSAGALLDKVDWSKLGTKLSGAFLGLIHSVNWGQIGGAVGDALITALQASKALGAKFGAALKTIIDAVDWEKVGHDSTNAIGRFLAGIDWPQLGKTLGLSVVGSLKLSAEVRQAVINAATDVLIGAYNALGEWGKQKALEWGPKLWEGLKSGIVTGARGIGAWLKSSFVDPVISSVKSFFGVRSPSTVFAGIGRELVAGLKGGVSGAARGIGSWLYNNVAVPAVRPFSLAGTWLSRAGRELIGGLTGGIAIRMRGISGWIKGNVVDPIVGAVKNFFGIKSPSRVFAGIGFNLVAGLVKGMATTNGASIVRTIFGDMPGALRAIVGKGLVGMSSLPQKALDALGFGADFNVPGVIPGALSGPNRRVFYQGEALDLSTYNKLAQAMKAIGGINVTQGSYERASSYSGTTHTGGGVFDVVGGNLTRILGALKSSGLIGWIRNPSQGPWPWHIHALDPSQLGRMSASARAQVGDYYRGGDGLAGYKLGTPWVPNDQLAFLHKGEAVIPADVNRRFVRPQPPPAAVVSEPGSLDAVTIGALARALAKEIAKISLHVDLDAYRVDYAMTRYALKRGGS